ncbi:MAG: nuclear transport factor 2 family protein [Myxococcales bacterium]|nr:nuclear transport factor 2 family protein [Myxococcales bacterium]
MPAPTLPMRIKDFYERVSVEREAALEDLPKLYAPEVRFVNPVVDETGLVTFEAYWKKALRQYKRFVFKDLEVVGDDALFTLTYTMEVRFAVGPVFVNAMSTDCHGRDGKVVFCRDYFDPLGTLVSPFPVASWLYKKVFGLLVA